MTTDRAAYISGLHKLADMLEQHDEIPLPSLGDSDEFPVKIYVRDVQQLRAAIAVFGPMEMRAPRASFFDFVGSLDGLHVAASISPYEVATQETVERTKTTTEWVLRPGVLDDAAVTA